jgi:glyoxylase-like metal-dependent hydrolase (beta-lactamase superfamily II)
VLNQVAEGVFTHQSEVLANNAVVVQGGAGVLLVDPGLTTAEMSCLARDLRELGQPVVAGFATHPDWDHALWHADLGDAPRYGTARCASYLQELRSGADWKDRVARALPSELADDVPLDLFGLITGLTPCTEALPWDGPRARIIEHPAHAPGHAALLIEEHGVLVAGDMLSDVFVPMFDDSDGSNDPVADYLRGLELLEDAAACASLVVPGHGSVGRADELRARIELDHAYVEALRDGEPVRDPRVDSPAPGWEWVSDIHSGNVAQWAMSTKRE